MAHFGRGRCRVDPGAGGADDLDPKLAHHPFLAVFGDDRDVVVLGVAAFGQSLREIEGHTLIVGPGEFLPHPVLFLTQGDFRSDRAGVLAQQPGQGAEGLVRDGAGDDLIHVSVLSLWAP